MKTTNQAGSNAPMIGKMTGKMIGKAVPNVTFRVRENDEWKAVTSNDLFAGKTVVLFSLPGLSRRACRESVLNLPC